MKSRFFQACLIVVLLISFVGFNGLERGLAQTTLDSISSFLPGDAAVSAAAVAQVAPAIERGGDTYLVAWADRRSSPPDAGSEYETANDIYAVRLDSAGNPLDSLPFVVTQAPANQDRPQVSWNGTHWLVVFESTSINGTGGYYEQSLAAVRVGVDGSVLDPKPIPILNTVPNIGTWSVASDGDGWIVAFQGSAASNDLQAIRIQSDGQVLQPSVSLLPETYYLRFNLHLAYANGVYLLTWTDSYNVLGLRFDGNLQVLDAAPFEVAASTTGSVLASNGSEFYVVWNMQQPDFTLAVTGTRVSTDGVVLDGAGDNISGFTLPAPDTITSVAWDGINWQISWGHNNLVMISRVSPAGEVLDFGGIAVSGPNTGFSVGDGAGGIQLVWPLSAYDQSDIVSARINASHVADPNHILSTGAPMQLYSDFAAGSNGYMAVYRSDTASAHRIHVQPLDINGDPLLNEPVELESGDTIYGPGRPSVAWNGSLYLVAWGNNSGIFAQRVQQDGTVLDAQPFLVIAAGFGKTDIAAVGDTFLVVAQKYGSYPQYVYPVAARVQGSNGAVLDTPPLYVGESYARSVAVTAFGDRWLTVWYSNYTHDHSVGATGGNFVNADGTFGTSFTIYGPYTLGGNGINELTAASNGTTALVVQSAEVTSGVETDLVGRLVNSDGSLQILPNLTPWVGNQYRPRAAWDGYQYVLAYTDQKNRFAEQTIDALDARGDLFGMRIASNGSILDPQGFAYSSLPIAETHPNVASIDGVSLFSGSIMRNEASFAAYRVGFTRMGVGGNQWPVAVAQSNKTNGNIPLNVLFNSTGSSDFDGTITSYYWEFGDGNTSTIANPEHTYTIPGNYVVKLVVTDDGGATSTQTLAVKVTAPNLLPVAFISASPLSGQPPLDVTFSARGSYDPDGRLGNFHWEFSDGTDSWGPMAYQTFYSAGIYNVTLTAYDDRGGTGTDTITIYVGQPNQAPVAIATASPMGGNVPLDVNFTSSDSYDPDGTLTSVMWEFGDGNTSTLPNPAHTYTASGSYQATLTVTDNLGLSDSTSLEVIVSGVDLPPTQFEPGLPGQPSTYTLLVNYFGSDPSATFDVSVNITGEQWAVEVPASIGPIPSGGSAPLEIIVHVPAEAAGGQQSIVEITLTSQSDGGITATSVLTTRVAYQVFLPALLVSDPSLP